MDISPHKFWEPYSIAIEDHVIHDAASFDHSQWPCYLPLQNHGAATSNSSSSQLAAPPGLLRGHLKGDGDQDQEADEPEEELGAMKEMMFKIAAMQPVDIDPATIRKPRRRNVRISNDPQSVAARHRRERISEKIRILQRLVPGGAKMDTASMLDEAIRYVKFLKRQIRILQSNHQPPPCVGIPAAAVPADDWAAVTTKAAASAAPGTSYGAVGDDPMCFSHKFMND